MRQRILMAAAMTAVLATVSPVAAQQQGDQPKQGDQSKQGQGQPGPMMGRAMMGGTATPNPGRWMMGPGMMHGGAMMGMGSCMTGEWIDGQLAFLRTELKLTDVQGKQWDDFAKAIHSNADRMASVHEEMWNTGMWSTLPAPDRMEKMQQMMSQHLEASKDIIGASKPLYASLSDEQKETFDTLVPACMGMM